MPDDTVAQAAFEFLELISALLHFLDKQLRKKKYRRFKKALESGDVQQLKPYTALLDKSEADYVGNSYDPTHPLLSAVRRQQLDLVAYLLAQQVNPNPFDDKGDKPLIIACRHQNQPLAELLVRHSATQSNGLTGETPLHILAQLGNLNMFQWFVREGWDTEATDKAGNTPLLTAIQWNQSDIITLLLQRKAAVHVRNQSGKTPLICAVIAQNEALVETLLQQRADVHAADDQGKTALHHAAQADNLDIVRLLLEYKSPVNNPSLEGWTPLLYATEQHNAPMMELLLQHGADRLHQDPQGRTVLELIQANRHFELLDILRKYV